MKRKLLLTFLMVALFVCVFAISVSAYTPAASYNYYKDSIAEENLMYSATTQIDPTRGRFEMTVTETENKFPKFDSEGNALTWYVVEEKTVDNARHFLCKAVKTVGEAGTVDANGRYSYGGGTETAVTAKNVVSVCFFGTGVKSFPDEIYMLDGAQNPPHSSEYCLLANGSHLLFLYLPKTLTAFPARMCLRSPVRVIEFEENRVNCKEIKGVESVSNGSSPFAFCANLKAISIPEGIETVSATVFRENCSLSYVKFPNSMTKYEKNIFFRCNNLQTVVLGDKMTFAPAFNISYTTMKNQGIHMKYMYVPNTINSANSYFDSYRGESTGCLMIDCNIVFFFAGSLDDAKLVGNFTDKHFRNAIANKAITYTEYLDNKETYDNYTGHILVYDIPVCDAFYNGVHEYVDELVYTDALSPIVSRKGCARCNTLEEKTYAPIFEALGYSAQIGGDMVCLGYKVNEESLAVCPKALSYGVLATVPSEGADMSAYEPLNPDLTPAVTNAVAMHVVEDKCEYIELIVSSFSKDTAYYDMDFVMCAFISDGESVDYLVFDEYNNAVQSEYVSAVTFKYITEECLLPKYSVTFKSNNDKMGSVEGELSQIVKEGKSASVVTAIPKEGYEFVCWNDGTKTASIEYVVEENTELIACFAPKSTGLPVMTIDTEGGANITTKDYYINCEITINDTTEDEFDRKDSSIGAQAAEIKGRGNSTWDKFDKKPYKFKFEDKQNLFGYGKEKTWVLLADARDYSLARNMIALNAAGSMSELTYTSKGQSVELYVNGVYKGVYYLCEQIQVKSNRVAIEEDGEKDENGNIKPESLGYLLEMDAWAADGKNQSGIANYTKDGDVFVTINGGQKPFVIKDPEDVFFTKDTFDPTKAKPYLEYIQNYLQQAHNAIYGDDYAKVCELIDVKSFAQSYIIFDLFKNPDVNYSSVYYYKDAGGKLVSAPVWDFDMSVGNVTHKDNTLCGKDASMFRDETFLWTAQQNYWLKELLEFQEFKDLIGQELIENASAIRASIASDVAYLKAHKEAYEKNFTVWNLIGNTGASEKMGAWSVPTEFKQFATWEEHIDYIANYLELSLQNLIKVYPAPAAE